MGSIHFKSGPKKDYLYSVSPIIANFGALAMILRACLGLFPCGWPLYESSGDRFGECYFQRRIKVRNCFGVSILISWDVFNLEIFEVQGQLLDQLEIGFEPTLLRLEVYIELINDELGVTFHD